MTALLRARRPCRRTTSCSCGGRPIARRAGAAPVTCSTQSTLNGVPLTKFACRRNSGRPPQADEHVEEVLRHRLVAPPGEPQTLSSGNRIISPGEVNVQARGEQLLPVEPDGEQQGATSEVVGEVVVGDARSSADVFPRPSSVEHSQNGPRPGAGDPRHAAVRPEGTDVDDAVPEWSSADSTGRCRIVRRRDLVQPGREVRSHGVRSCRAATRAAEHRPWAEPSASAWPVPIRYTDRTAGPAKISSSSSLPAGHVGHRIPVAPKGKTEGTMRRVEAPSRQPDR